jgi:hypothetical protein
MRDLTIGTFPEIVLPNPTRKIGDHPLIESEPNVNEREHCTNGPRYNTNNALKRPRLISSSTNRPKPRVHRAHLVSERQYPPAQLGRSSCP